MDSYGAALRLLTDWEGRDNEVIILNLYIKIIKNGESIIWCAKNYGYLTLEDHGFFEISKEDIESAFDTLDGVVRLKFIDKKLVSLDAYQEPTIPFLKGFIYK